MQEDNTKRAGITFGSAWYKADGDDYWTGVGGFDIQSVETQSSTQIVAPDLEVTEIVTDAQLEDLKNIADEMNKEFEAEGSDIRVEVTSGAAPYSSVRTRVRARS